MSFMRVPFIAVLSSPIPNLYFILVTFIFTLIVCGQGLHIYIYSVARSFEARNFQAGDVFEGRNLLQPMRKPTRDPLWSTPVTQKQRGH